LQFSEPDDQCCRESHCFLTKPGVDIDLMPHAVDESVARGRVLCGEGELMMDGPRIYQGGTLCACRGAQLTLGDGSSYFLKNEHQYVSLNFGGRLMLHMAILVLHLVTPFINLFFYLLLLKYSEKQLINRNQILLLEFNTFGYKSNTAVIMLPMIPFSLDQLIYAQPHKTKPVCAHVIHGRLGACCLQ
jgi:hypothetical protein